MVARIDKYIRFAYAQERSFQCRLEAKENIVIDEFTWCHTRLRATCGLNPMDRQFLTVFLPQISERRLPLPNQELLFHSKLTLRLELGFKVMLTETLECLQLGQLARRETGLIELVILWQYHLALTNGTWGTHDKHALWNGVLGAMIQQRLALCLLEMPHADRVFLYDWGNRFSDEIRNMWRIRMAGALSETRAMNAMLNLGDMDVYLPTAEEDLNKGIDLFMCGSAGNYAIGIKTIGGHNRFTATALTPAFMRDLSETDQRFHKILRGSQWASERYNLPFTAMFVGVPAPTPPWQMNLDAKDSYVLSEAIESSAIPSRSIHEVRH